MPSYEYHVVALQGQSSNQLAGGNMWGNTAGINGVLKTATEEGWELFQMDTSAMALNDGSGVTTPQFDCILTFRRPSEQSSAD